MSRITLLILVSTCLMPIKNALAQHPTALKADYGLPERQLTAADLGLEAREALVIDYHLEQENLTRMNGFIKDDFLNLFDEKMLRFAIQGMINRSGPFIYMDFTKYGVTSGDPVWLKYYGQTHGYKFKPIDSRIDALIQRFAPLFNGIILYEPVPSDNYFLAANIASMNFCLPVSRKLYDTHRQAFGKLPVVLHIEKNRFSRKTAYQWMIKNLVPKMDRTAAMSLCVRFPDNQMGPREWPHYVMGGMDYPFYRKNLIFNVSCLPAPSEIVVGGPNDRGYMQGSALDHEVFADIMKSLIAPAQVFGWNTAEAPYTLYGHMMFHNVWFSSGSFHAGVKPLTPPPYHQDLTPKIDQPKKKVYLAFMANESDTVSHDALFHWGAWQRPERGKVPMNWGINPAYITLFPAMYEYFMRTKTGNDFFVLPPTGAGYVHADFMSMDQIRTFLRFTQQAMDRGLNYNSVVMWGCNRRDIHDAFVDMLPGLTGIFPKPTGIHPYGLLYHIERPGRRVPVLYEGSNLGHYWVCNNGYFKVVDGKKVVSDELINKLNNIYNKMPLPFFSEFYGLEGDAPEAILDLKNRLDPEKFEIIDMGTMAHLAAQVESNAGNAPISREVPANVLDWKAEYATTPAPWKTEGGCQLSAVPGGLKIKLAPDKDWGIVYLANVRLPRDAARMSFTIPHLTGGAWEVNLYGYAFEDGRKDFGYALFGQLPWLGHFVNDFDPGFQAKVKAGEVLPQLQIGVRGLKGAEVIFKDIQFSPAPRQVAR